MVENTANGCSHIMNVGSKPTSQAYTYYSAASEYETSWFERIQTAQKNICSVVAEPEHEEASKVIVSRTLDLLSLPPTIKLTSSDSSPPTFFQPKR